MGDSNAYRFVVDAGLGGVSSVVSSLPAGYNLGERRIVAGVEYKLCHNAGTSAIDAGKVASNLPLAGAGLNSVTVSTASKSFHHLGAVVVVHATVPTANYFWGAVNGPVGGLFGDASSTPTGSVFYIGSNGAVELMPQSVITGSKAIGVNLGSAASKTITTGARSGDCLINIEG